MNASNDPLHGKKLADILDELLDYYGGFEGLRPAADPKTLADSFAMGQTLGNHWICCFFFLQVVTPPF